MHLNYGYKSDPWAYPRISLCPLRPPRWSSSHISDAQFHALYTSCPSPNYSPVLKHIQSFLSSPSTLLILRISPSRERFPLLPEWCPYWQMHVKYLLPQEAPPIWAPFLFLWGLSDHLSCHYYGFFESEVSLITEKAIISKCTIMRCFVNISPLHPKPQRSVNVLVS